MYSANACFQSKGDCGFSHDRILELNREEVKKYKDSLERTRTRYILDDEKELEDGSITLHIRKQYNDKTDVAEYFN